MHNISLQSLSPRSTGKIRSFWSALLLGFAIISTGFAEEAVSSYTYTLRIEPNTDTNGEQTQITNKDSKQAIDTLEKRLQSKEVKFEDLKKSKNNDINVKILNITEQEKEKINGILTEKVRLEIRALHSESESLLPSVKAGTSIPNYEILTGTHTNDDGENVTREYLVNRRVIVGGESVQNAFVVGNQKGMVSVKLNEEGGQKMFEHTSKMTPGVDLMATVLDGEVLSAATLRHGALRRNFTINGMETQEECKKLANGLENPLKNPIKIIEIKEIPR